jgi:hypothetical protein
MIETVRAKDAPHDDLESSLGQRHYTQIDHWLDENMANSFEDALQANLQSRTKPDDREE